MNVLNVGKPIEYMTVDVLQKSNDVQNVVGSLTYLMCFSHLAIDCDPFWNTFWVSVMLFSGASGLDSGAN